MSVFKRTFDIMIAAVALLILWPALLVVFIIVKFGSKGPGIFWSERVGQHGRVFLMPKFRSMTTCSKVISREVVGSGDIRIAGIGNFLRKTSIDELPQLWSVLIGHMSLIGPRALLPNDVAQVERLKFPEIMSIKPGMTGLAQINGRNSVKPRSKARYDAFYVRRVCLFFDIRILLRTLVIVRNTKLVQ